MPSQYEQILSLCQAKGVRPGRLCDDLGISRGLISDLKMGRKKSLSVETAQKIASYFNVSVDQLLGQDDSRDPLNDIDIAFYGAFKELNEDEKDTVRDMVRIMRERRTGRQRD